VKIREKLEQKYVLTRWYSMTNRPKGAFYKVILTIFGLIVTLTFDSVSGVTGQHTVSLQ